MSDGHWLLVDSCGWIEYFMRSPLGAQYLPAFAHPKRLLVPTICLHEVVKTIHRKCDRETADRAALVMQKGILVPLDDEIALLAADFSLAEQLATADAVVYATARRHNATLWTQDAHFEGKPGVKFFRKA